MDIYDIVACGHKAIVVCACKTWCVALYNLKSQPNNNK